MGFFADNIDVVHEGVMNEAGWGVDKDATSIRKVQKWYDKFVRYSTNKAESKEMIDDRIEVLERSSKMMKDTLTNKNGMHGSEQVKYVLKELIPFNSISRLIHKQDAYAAIGILTDTILPGSSYVVRAVAFDNMLEDSIKKTDAAIEYLKNERKKL
jgi:hypothetical protein